MDIDGLYFDDESESKLRAHGLTIDDVQQVYDGRPRFYVNRPDHRASHVMVGEAVVGRSGKRTILVVPIEEWGGGLWRVVTAFEPTTAQEDRYRSTK